MKRYRPGLARFPEVAPDEYPHATARLDPNGRYVSLEDVRELVKTLHGLVRFVDFIHTTEPFPAHGEQEWNRHRKAAMTYIEDEDIKRPIQDW